jgi:hypothetical protein
VSLTPTNTEAQVAETSKSHKSGECISVEDTLKLFPSFKGNKSELLVFMGKVDPAISVINPNHEDKLYKFL